MQLYTINQNSMIYFWQDFGLLLIYILWLAGLRTRLHNQGFWYTDLRTVASLRSSVPVDDGDIVCVCHIKRRGWSCQDTLFQISRRGDGEGMTRLLCHSVTAKNDLTAWIFGQISRSSALKTMSTLFRKSHGRDLWLDYIWIICLWPQLFQTSNTCRSLLWLLHSMGEQYQHTHTHTHRSVTMDHAILPYDKEA